MPNLEEEVGDFEYRASYDYILEHCDYKDPAYETAIHNITNHGNDMSFWRGH